MLMQPLINSIVHVLALMAAIIYHLAVSLQGYLGPIGGSINLIQLDIGAPSMVGLRLWSVTSRTRIHCSLKGFFLFDFIFFILFC